MRPALACRCHWHFYPRPPRGGRPRVVGVLTCAVADFYPRPPRGGRQNPNVSRPSPISFLSTPSARRATNLPPAQNLRAKNFYPRPPRGGRPLRLDGTRILDSISIHALREEGDLTRFFKRDSTKAFLSTPSARRATNCPVVADIEVGISIHALREEGDPCSAPCLTSPADFYPRPPRGGRRRAMPG